MRCKDARYLCCIRYDRLSMNCNELEQQIDRATGTPTSTSANPPPPPQKKSRERLCEVTCYCRLLEYTAFLLFSRDTIHAVSSYVAYLDIKNQVQARFHPPFLYRTIPLYRVETLHRKPRPPHNRRSRAQRSLPDSRLSFKYSKMVDKVTFIGIVLRIDCEGGVKQNVEDPSNTRSSSGASTLPISRFWMIPRRR